MRITDAAIVVHRPHGDRRPKPAISRSAGFQQSCGTDPHPQPRAQPSIPEPPGQAENGDPLRSRHRPGDDEAPGAGSERLFHSEYSA